MRHRTGPASTSTHFLNTRILPLSFPVRHNDTCYLRTLAVRKARMALASSDHVDFHPIHPPSSSPPMFALPPTKPRAFTLLHGDQHPLILSTTVQTSIEVFYFNVVQRSLHCVSALALSPRSPSKINPLLDEGSGESRG
ncbi:hypothetical protein GALMADRAFT_1209803 [Galerina marginata CBS 339.88]|uniref:Uncharacterized protein n=1 Tax=Galerina marginata (strain CBS 339.88) TaxID=685588 RepID=A0A067SEH7_GALM3|nr:hypothetical protein GALMADRAFT_1209803 [Galerina marginata CBS 339.88]